MNKEQLNQLVKEYYGFTIDEIDNDIGYWSNRFTEERDKRKQLQTNWNELKKWLEELQQEEFDINGFTGVCTEIRLDCILDKMTELERGEE